MLILRHKKETVRGTSAAVGLPKSTVHHHLQQSKFRSESSGENFWETEQGYHTIVRLVVGTIYIFGVKGGKGAGTLSEFFKMTELDKHAGLSQSSILKIIKRIECLILEYKDAVEKEIRSKVDEIKLILGVDETWFDQMYLVCQELSSGYIFFEEPSDDRKAETWDRFIKKTLYTTT